MKLNVQQQAALAVAIDRELKVQDILSQAREAAATAIATYFKTKPDAAPDTASKIPARIRAAIQFTARAFQPLTTLLRAVTKKGESNSATDASAQPAPESPVIKSQHYRESARKRKARLQAEAEASDHTADTS